MELDTSKHGNTVLIPSKAWNDLQIVVDDAIDRCNDVTAQIANHRINGMYNADGLLDQIDGEVREIRKLIERLVTPF